MPRIVVDPGPGVKRRGSSSGPSGRRGSGRGRRGRRRWRSSSASARPGAGRGAGVVQQENNTSPCVDEVTISRPFLERDVFFSKLLTNYSVVDNFNTHSAFNRLLNTRLKRIPLIINTNQSMVITATSKR